MKMEITDVHEEKTILPIETCPLLEETRCWVKFACELEEKKSRQIFTKEFDIFMDGMKQSNNSQSDQILFGGFLTRLRYVFFLFCVHLFLFILFFPIKKLIIYFLYSTAQFFYVDNVRELGTRLMKWKNGARCCCATIKIKVN